LKHKGHKEPLRAHEASHFLTRAPSESEGIQGLPMSLTWSELIETQETAMIAKTIAKDIALLSHRTIAGGIEGRALRLAETMVA